uniref:Kinesin light chain n=1 Tax=Chaetoceros debilis TaxID=122233 RepID=A0A7S3PUK0_9STRA|mmetsp:Transcript_12278/g.17906  ORF Transcript_12278/g.17906 Transcript_12278/m.17906 type:complete len:239 (-) Transcript_12278:28-744(-)
MDSTDTESPSNLPAHEELMGRLNCELHERVTTLGFFHPSVANTYNSMALIYHHMRCDHRIALRLHVKALQIFGNAHKQILSVKGDHADARKRMSIEFAVTLSDIGNVYWALGNVPRAELAFEEALNVLNSENIDESHPRKYSIRNRLFALQRLSGLDDGFRSEEIIRCRSNSMRSNGTHLSVISDTSSIHEKEDSSSRTSIQEHSIPMVLDTSLKSSTKAHLHCLKSIQEIMDCFTNE